MPLLERRVPTQRELGLTSAVLHNVIPESNIGEHTLVESVTAVLARAQQVPGSRRHYDQAAEQTVFTPTDLAIATNTFDRLARPGGLSLDKQIAVVRVLEQEHEMVSVEAQMRSQNNKAVDIHSEIIQPLRQIGTSMVLGVGKGVAELVVGWDGALALMNGKFQEAGADALVLLALNSRKIARRWRSRRNHRRQINK